MEGGREGEGEGEGGRQGCGGREREREREGGGLTRHGVSSPVMGIARSHSPATETKTNQSSIKHTQNIANSKDV